MIKFYFSNVTSKKIDQYRFFYAFGKYIVILAVPVAVVGLIAGVVMNIVQNKGWIYTTKTIKPNFSKIVPKFGEYFKKNFFSMMGLFNIIKSILKVAVIGVIAFFFIRTMRDSCKNSSQLYNAF